jgi:hypothetical protein
MTDNQRKWLYYSKTSFDFTNKIISPVTSAVVILLVLYFSRNIAFAVTGSQMIGDMVFLTLLFLTGLNVVSSTIYNYISSKITSNYVNKQIERLKNGPTNDAPKDDSNSGHSRGNTGTEQPDSQDSSPKA